MLKIENLNCGYDLKFNLLDINLKVAAGELVGIIGPNGSGKTTLLKAITKVIKPKKGNILFEGKDIWQMGLKDLAKKIAVISQDSEIGYITVEEFVLLGRIPHYERFQFLETKNDLDIAKRCMRLTDTFKLKNRLIAEISSGERQTVLVARALAQEPKLLLLDEPTTHLDITHQIKILDLVKKLNKEFKLTVIMVLHDLNLASEYCQRLVLINKGRVYSMGTPEEVLKYQIIEEVYKTIVVVEKNPISSKPFILIVPEEARERQSKIKTTIKTTP
ncbi:MAG: ABC transporter ATP-binding protein [Candidatus Firestonebacteria bacterium]